MSEETLEQEQEHGHAAQPAELQKLRQLLDTHGKPVAIAAGVVVATILVVNGIRMHRESKVEHASARLGSARSIQELDAVITDFGSTPAAPLARLRLARNLYDQGNYDAALNKYDEVLSEHPDHRFALGAELGRIHCMEAKGQTADALSAFAEFAADHPDHYLTPQAIFGSGRCLERMGQDGEARTLYEDFIAANPESGWLPRAEERLEKVLDRLGPQEEDSAEVSGGEVNEVPEPETDQVPGS